MFAPHEVKKHKKREFIAVTITAHYYSLPTHDKGIERSKRNNLIKEIKWGVDL